MSNADPVPSMSEVFPNVKNGKPDRDGEESALADAVRGHSVLVTGAGGSLGVALAQHLSTLPVERLLLLDTSEQGLVRLRERLGTPEIGAATNGGAAPSLHYRLADLRVAADRKRVLDRQPSIVIHAAAYKHVPFLEERPIAAVQNNLLATIDWLRACEAQSTVDQFVLVSTDKAVRPTSVMGATKAAAEQGLRAETTDLDPNVARLCNVFGSRGSVVPRFCRRLREGQLLPVTHPEMERWFVGAKGAAEAVLHTLRHEPGTYVPRQRVRIRIADLAWRLAQWHYSPDTPEDWIRYVGLRAGERLRESLLAPEEQPSIPVNEHLSRAHSPQPVSPKQGVRGLERLRRDCRTGNAEAVRAELISLLTSPVNRDRPPPDPRSASRPSKQGA